MPTALVLIGSEIGSERDVIKNLKKIDGVSEAYEIYGVYDIIAKVDANTQDKLKEIITLRIRRLDKIKSTVTLLVIEG